MNKSMINSDLTVNIYKLTNKHTGEYLIESAMSEDKLFSGRFNSVLEGTTEEDWEIELLSSHSPSEDISLVKFKEAINQINLDEQGYNLLNGRFRVSEQLKNSEIYYVYTIYNEETNKHYIDYVPNVISRLYRTIRKREGRSDMVHDLEESGLRKIHVQIDGPFTKEKAEEYSLLYYGILDDKDIVYNWSKYEKLSKLHQYSAIESV